MASALESSGASPGSGWRLLALMSGLIATKPEEVIGGAAPGYGSDFATLILCGVPFAALNEPPESSDLDVPEEVKETARIRAEERLNASWFVEIARSRFRLGLDSDEWSSVWWLVEKLHAQGVATGEIKIGWEKQFLWLRGEMDEFRSVELATKAQAIQFRILHSGR